MLNVKNTMVDTLISLVAPHLCSGCGRIGGTFCDNCKYDISIEYFSGCVLCEKTTPRGVCDDHKVAFNQAWVVGIRSGPLQRLIGGLKFRNKKAAAYDLALLLHKRLPKLPSSTIFVPIPTSPAHIRERGYDHMLLIAKHLSKLRHAPTLSLLKKENNLTQHHADRKQRLSQAAHAFMVEGYIDSHATYVLLDDVVTTGATITQAAFMLRKAGATTIWVAATSRQPLD